MFIQLVSCLWCFVTQITGLDWTTAPNLTILHSNMLGIFFLMSIKIGLVFKVIIKQNIRSLFRFGYLTISLKHLAQNFSFLHDELICASLSCDSSQLFPCSNHRTTLLLSFVKWSLFSSRDQLTLPGTGFGPRVPSTYVSCLMFCHIDHEQRLKDCHQLHPPTFQKQYHHYLINSQRTRNLMKFYLKKWIVQIEQLHDCTDLEIQMAGCLRMRTVLSPTEKVRT